MLDYFSELESQVSANGLPADCAPNKFMSAMITGGDAIDEKFMLLLSQSWRVKGWIPESAKLIEFYGPPGTYKSFLVLDVALCIATGRDWHGHPVKKCRVVYVAAEGQAGILKRVRAWQEFHHVSSDELALFTILPRPCLIDLSRELDALIGAFNELPGPQVEFIVIDTLARSMTGDENSTSDMGNVVNACGQLTESTGSAQIALVHHTGKDENRGPRGAIALTGATDVLFEVSKPADRTAALQCHRQKDDEPQPDLFFDLLTQGTGYYNLDGDELASLVPDYNAEKSKHVKKDEKLRGLKGANKIAFDAFRMALQDSGECPSESVMNIITRKDVAMPFTQVVHEDVWRKAAYDQGISGVETTPQAKKKAFDRARHALLYKEIVRCFEGFYWLV